MLIPPGALTEDRLITIKTHRDISTLPFPAPFVGGARLGPDGLTFQLPVTIILPLLAEIQPGTQLPLFLYDNQRNGWLYANQFAVVNLDKITATAQVSHFTDYIVMGITEGDQALYFGRFRNSFFDICNPTPTVDLYSDLIYLWSSVYFPIGSKKIWDFLRLLQIVLMVAMKSPAYVSL